MTTDSTAPRRIHTLAEIRAALERTPIRRRQLHEHAFTRHNRAVGERHEAAVAYCLNDLGLNPLRLPQDRASKHDFCPPDGKRPDILIDVDGDDCFLDVKFHHLGIGGFFALKDEELSRYDAFMNQFTSLLPVSLIFAVVPKQKPGTIYLIPRQRLIVPGIIAGMPASGVDLGIRDRFHNIPNAVIAKEESRLIASGRFKASDFQVPTYRRVRPPRPLP